MREWGWGCKNGDGRIRMEKWASVFCRSEVSGNNRISPKCFKMQKKSSH